MATPTTRRACVVCGDITETANAWPECAQGHAISIECFSGYILHTWSSRDFGIGVIPELTCCVATCTAPPFSAQLIARYASAEAWTAYDNVRRRGIEAGAIAEVQNLLAAASSRPSQRDSNTAQRSMGATVEQHEEEQSRILLGEQLRRQVVNARMCPQCHFGPIDHAWCGDLLAHHGEVRNGAVINNACPQCGYFAPHEAGWPRWDGILRAPAQRHTQVQGPEMAIAEQVELQGGGQISLIMHITQCTAAQAQIALQESILRHGEEQEHIVDGAVEIALERFPVQDQQQQQQQQHTGGDGPVHQASPSSWRFQILQDDLFCERRGLRLRLWEQSNGWFEAIQDHSRRSVFSSSENEADNVIPLHNRAPVQGIPRETPPQSFGQWIFRQQGSIFEVRNRLRPRNLLYLTEEGWSFDDTDAGVDTSRPMMERMRSARRIAEGIRAAFRPPPPPTQNPGLAPPPSLAVHSLQSMMNLTRNSSATTPTRWRFRLVGNRLECCRRGLHVMLPTSPCNGFFETRSGLDRTSTTCWSAYRFSYNLQDELLATSTAEMYDRNYSASFPLQIGSWTLQNLGDSCTMARCTDGGRVLYFTNDRFEGLREVDSPRPGEELAYLNALRQFQQEQQLQQEQQHQEVEDAAEDLLWRFRLTGTGLQCRRRGLLVELPLGCNGWFSMQLNAEEESQVMFSSSEGDIGIAPGNQPPIEQEGFCRAFPASAGVWTLQRVGEAIGARCNNSSGRVLVFKPDSFVYFKESSSPSSLEDIPYMLESAEDSAQRYLTSTPWRFITAENGEFRMLRRRLEVRIRSQGHEVFVKTNDDPTRCVPSDETSGTMLAPANRPPIRDVPGASEAFPARFGSWQFERIGHDIVVRNTGNNRTLVLGPHQLLHSESEQTVQIPTSLGGSASQRSRPECRLQ